MDESIVRKCPFCSGDMLRSRMPAGAIVFLPPWGGVLTPRFRALPWACLTCGVVLHYLENLPALSVAYRKRAEKKLAKSEAPSPIKP